jgi:hypothetical protein
MKKNNGQVSRGRHAMDDAATAMEQMALYCTAHPGSPSSKHRPRLFFRSELWIALIGASVEEGIVGIGPTVGAALGAFDAQYMAVQRLSLLVGPALCARPRKFSGQRGGRRRGLLESFLQSESSIRMERCDRELSTDSNNRPHILMRSNQREEL